MIAAMIGEEYARRRLGQVIDGRYELKRILGLGMTGAVYEAHHKYTHRAVAVKVMHQIWSLASRARATWRQRSRVPDPLFSLPDRPRLFSLAMLFPIRRRTALRRGVRAPCQAVLLEPFRHVGEELLDLSHQGAQLVCDVALVEGDELVLSFEVCGQIIDAIAEVRNVTPNGRSAGVRFTEMDWDSRVALFIGLSGIPPRVPRYRPQIDYARSVRAIAVA